MSALELTKDSQLIWEPGDASIILQRESCRIELTMEEARDLLEELTQIFDFIDKNTTITLSQE